MMKSHEETGGIIHRHAKNLGSKLAAIKTAIHLVQNSLGTDEENTEFLSEYHRINLLRGARALTESIYGDLIVALGNETALVDIKLAREVDEQERRQ